MDDNNIPLNEITDEQRTQLKANGFALYLPEPPRWPFHHAMKSVTGMVHKITPEFLARYAVEIEGPRKKLKKLKLF